MSDSKEIPVVADKELASGIDAQAADKAAAESEQTGKIPRSKHLPLFPSTVVATSDIALLSGEVEDLKDSIGGGETLDNEVGVTTRGAEQDAYAQEKQVDKLDL
jgi:hypothetical protein